MDAPKTVAPNKALASMACRISPLRCFPARDRLFFFSQSAGKEKEGGGVREGEGEVVTTTNGPTAYSQRVVWLMK